MAGKEREKKEVDNFARGIYAGLLFAWCCVAGTERVRDCEREIKGGERYAMRVISKKQQQEG